MSRNTLNTLKEFPLAPGQSGQYYSLPALAESLGVNLSRLPVSIRIVLESVLRNCDGKKVTEEHVKQLAGWGANAARTDGFLSSSRASCCKTSPAYRCWPTWPRCATSPAKWA
jgi:aconitase A